VRVFVFVLGGSGCLYSYLPEHQDFEVPLDLPLDAEIRAQRASRKSKH
jgi:hypothetical protein